MTGSTAVETWNMATTKVVGCDSDGNEITATLPFGGVAIGYGGSSILSTYVTPDERTSFRRNRTTAVRLLRDMAYAIASIDETNQGG